jgi:hypothetical protein
MEELPDDGNLRPEPIRASGLGPAGLSIPEIAARLGLGMANAHRRIKRLTKGE